MEKLKVRFANEKIVFVSGMDQEIFSSLQSNHNSPIIEINDQPAMYFGMNFTEIIKELHRIGFSYESIKKEIKSFQEYCDHQLHINKNNFHFAQSDNLFANHKKGDMVCGKCGYHGKLNK